MLLVKSLLCRMRIHDRYRKDRGSLRQGLGLTCTSGQACVRVRALRTGNRTLSADGGWQTPGLDTKCVQSLLPNEYTSQRKLIIAIDGPGRRGQEHDCLPAGEKTRIREPGEWRDVSRTGAESDHEETLRSMTKPALVKLAEKSQIRLEPTIGGNRTLLDGKDVSSRIRERDVT